MHPVIRLGRVVIVAGLATGSAMMLLTPSLAAMGAGVRSGPGSRLPQLDALPQRSIVYAADGTQLTTFFDDQNRAPVPLSHVPKHVVNAILDTEDARFWDHDGVDLRSTVRALTRNVKSGAVEQGGSTITQQLVKQALLTPERSLDRKVKEAVFAVRMENELSKKEILERYLNTVYFGNTAYGVLAAAETYFTTNVEGLTVAQGALLAGLIRDPIGGDPLRNPDGARASRDAALDRMVANRHLSPGEAERLKAEPLPTKAIRPPGTSTDYFVEDVKRRLLADKRLGETPAERYNALFRGGLRIHTTLDLRMQKLAEDKVREQLPDTKGLFTAALVSLEPATGAVRAIVGGPGFEQFKYNIVTQGAGRQPGSSFKPFVLAAALEQGVSPNSIINGTSPCTFELGGAQKPWSPENFEGSAGGVMSLTDATAKSLNCAYARLGLVVGPAKVADMAKRLGITTKLDDVPAMALGSEEVRPLDMASAYATFANDGVHHGPYLIEKVVDREGKTVFDGRTVAQRIISAQNARVAVQVLEAVVERGTGTKARLPGRVAFGKTGTSQNHENAWFVGSTPQLTTAVWMGSPKGNVPMRSVGGIKVTGGSYPARIWHAFMAAALAGEPAPAFAPPDPSLIPPARYIDEKGIKEKPPNTTPRRPKTTVPPGLPTIPTIVPMPQPIQPEPDQPDQPQGPQPWEPPPGWPFNDDD